MNVLIVTHYFEPFNGVGALRMSSFSKFLVENGNDVTIIKANDKFYGRNTFPTKNNNNLNLISVNIENKKHARSDNARWRKAYKEKIESEINKKQFDWIIISGGPYFNFSLGRYFKKKYGINYILDFRDLWVYESRTPTKFISKIADKIRRALNSRNEHLAVKYAKYVLTVTPSDENRMLNAYKKFSEKFKVIFNGYDDKKLIGLQTKTQNIRHNKYINLMIFGKFTYYGIESSKIFFSTIRELFEMGYNIKITHIGNSELEINKLIEEYNLPNEIYKCLGPRDYEEGMFLLQSADILFSIYPVRSGLGTKIFDYIFQNKPVVLFGYKNSEIASFFGQFENFFCCESTLEGTNAIKQIIDTKNKKLDSNVNIKIFSRTYQWNIFYDLLKS